MTETHTLDVTSADRDTQRRSVSLQATAHVLIHVIVFGALAWWTWRKWSDPLVDFGRELYVPWQITEGQVLYRDIASLFGPLSPYLNAWLFELFGVSLTTLVWSNLAILALTIAGIHYLVRATCGSLVGTIATTGALLLFGFAHYVLVANYNFVSPYSHEATHGFALSVAMLAAIQAGIERRRLRWMGVAGVCFGLVLLTKPELALAASVAAMVAAAAAFASDRERLLPRRAILVFALAAACGPLGFLWYFAGQMPLPDAVAATAGAFGALGATGVAGGVFYRMVSGLDRPGANAILMLKIFGALGLFAAAVLVGSLSTKRDWRAAGGMLRRHGWLAALAVVLFLTPSAALFPRALPLTTATALAGLIVLFRRAGHDRQQQVKLIPAIAWCTFSLVLLAKMVLNARIFHYGFYLALPATTVLVMLLAWLVPLLLQRWHSMEVAAVFRRISLWMMVAAAVPYLLLSYMLYLQISFPVGAGRDRFYTFDDSGKWQGPAVARALATIERLTTRNDTVAVLPEGVMLNYLSRRASPLRTINLMPPELLTFGEQDALDSLERRRPLLVLLVERDMAEYGYPKFGTDARYGLRTMQWVEANYEPVQDQNGAGSTAEIRIRVLRRRAR